MMNRTTKIAVALALAGGVSVAAVATPSYARGGRIAAGVAGFAVGAAIGAAAANAGGYYGGPGYAYDPGYAYAPAYGYAYGPDYYASEPTWSYRAHHRSRCVVEGAYRPDYSQC